MRQIPEEVRRAVLERDSFDGCPCCIYCGKPVPVGAHLHHVIRRSQGGEDREDNLVTLCYKCHIPRLHGGEKEIQEYCEAYLRERYDLYNE